MFKYAGAILVIISCSLKGFEEADKLTTRLKNLKEIKNILLFVEREMQFSKTPLPKILENASEKSEKALIKEILSNTAKKINSEFSPAEAWQEEIKKNQSRLFLSKKEALEMAGIFQSLGESDSETQKKVIKNALEIIDDAILKCENVCRTNVKMYRSMGVLLGMFIALLFI